MLLNPEFRIYVGFSELKIAEEGSSTDKEDKKKPKKLINFKPR